MVDVVKTAFDVAFDKPFCADKFVGKLGQGRVAAPSGPESMGIVREHRLINRFQYHAHYFLHQLVRESRQSQRTHFAVRFLNIGAPHRLRTVGLASQCVNNSCHILLAESVRRIIVYTFCSSAFIRIQVLVGYIVNVRAEHIAKEPCKYFIMVFA